MLLNASRGLRLQAIAAEAAQASLRDPLAYGPTQQLGAWMRDQGIGAFEYLSARSMDALVQVGVFSPEVIQSTRFDQVEISTEISADHTTFLAHDDGKLHRFGRELFLIDGAFPGAAD